MEIIISLINKLLFILFFLSAINIIRHSFFFFIKFADNQKYNLDKKNLFYLGLSIAMVLTSFITTIKI